MRSQFARGSKENIERFGDSWETASDPQKMARRVTGYRGKGDYRSYARYIPRALGAGAGYLHSGFSGAKRGWQVGGNVSKALGLGDYQMGGNVQSNQIVDTPQDQMRIAVNPSNNSGDIIFEHSEFIGNVFVPGRSDASSGSLPSKFNVSSYAVNPGNSALFPFLSTIAHQFEMYEYQGIIVQYRPLSSESANDTNSLGKVILCTNYDPSAPAFTSSYAMENYDYSSSAKPSAGQVHGIETAPSQRLTTQLYVQSKDSPPGPAPVGMKDKLLTDLGLFQIATEGIPVDTVDQICGEIWISYKIKLSRATLVDVIEHKDLEFMALRSTVVIPNLSSELAVFSNIHVAPDSTLRMTQVDTGQSNVQMWNFPESVTTGTYQISAWYPYSLIVRSSNTAMLTAQGFIYNSTAGTITNANTTSGQDTSQLRFVTAVVRLDHVDVHPTLPQAISFVSTGFTGTGSPSAPLEVVFFIKEINSLEAQLYRPSSTDATQFGPWS